MNFYKKKSKQFMTVTMTVSLFFMTYLLLTPLLYNQNSEAADDSGFGNALGQRLPLKQEGQISYITSASAENEYLVDAVSYHIMSRSQQVSRQLPGLVNYAFAVLLVSFGILIYKCRNQFRDTKRQISVLAISLGGHAPPGLCNP